jgi:hypothetical protein
VKKVAKQLGLKIFLSNIKERSYYFKKEAEWESLANRQRES